MLERRAFGQVGDSAAKAVLPLVSVNIEMSHFWSPRSARSASAGGLTVHNGVRWSRSAARAAESSTMRRKCVAAEGKPARAFARRIPTARTVPATEVDPNRGHPTDQRSSWRHS